MQTMTVLLRYFKSPRTLNSEEDGQDGAETTDRKGCEKLVSKQGNWVS